MKEEKPEGLEVTFQETVALDRWYQALLQAEQSLVEARPSSVRYAVLDRLVEGFPDADPSIIARLRSARRSAAEWMKLSRRFPRTGE